MKRWKIKFYGKKGILYLFAALTALTGGLFAPIWLTYILINIGTETENVVSSTAG
jgi:hypothetical protein